MRRTKQNGQDQRVGRFQPVPSSLFSFLLVVWKWTNHFFDRPLDQSHENIGNVYKFRIRKWPLRRWRVESPRSKSGVKELSLLREYATNQRMRKESENLDRHGSGGETTPDTFEIYGENVPEHTRVGSNKWEGISGVSLVSKKRVWDDHQGQVGRENKSVRRSTSKSSKSKRPLISPWSNRTRSFTNSVYSSRSSVREFRKKGSEIHTLFVEGGKGELLCPGTMVSRGVPLETLDETLEELRGGVITTPTFHCVESWEEIWRRTVKALTRPSTKPYSKDSRDQESSLKGKLWNNTIDE